MVNYYQGMFLRGYGSQYSFHYGTVLHSSGNLGDLQGDAIRNITGSIARATNSAAWVGSTSGIFGTILPDGTGVGGNQQSPNYKGVDFDASRMVPTANENRPINKAVRFLIRAA